MARRDALAPSSRPRTTLDRCVRESTKGTACRKASHRCAAPDAREIFPGTFASTTETADWLLNALGLHRTPVLAWGPRGTQQLSEVHSGRFELRGYAGNSAPDHIDQLHGMPEFLQRLLQ